MITVFHFAGVFIALGATLPAPAAGAAGSGTYMAAADTVAENVVTGFSIRAQKLLLTSAAHPSPVELPDASYVNESGTIIVIVNGTITRVQRSSGSITDIMSIRLHRQRGVMLMPSTNALMAVTEITLPSGTFTSEDGSSSFTVLSGRPVAFTLPDKTQ